MARVHKPDSGRGRRAEIELETSLERARENPADEAAFFRRVLKATDYVHAPASVDSGKFRLVQFRHPDGFNAIPFFTSLRKAQIAGSSAVRNLDLPSRDLLASVDGAVESCDVRVAADGR